MIEHSVTEFFYFDELQFKRTANSQSYITNKLVPDRTKETVKKKLKLSLTSQKKKNTTKKTVGGIMKNILRLLTQASVGNTKMQAVLGR